MYRRTFVGREPELRQLQHAFDGAISGQGALTMVVGEPGIGKTALCEQLATYVAVRGGKALVGHSYEEGSLSLSYLPFVEALRSYVLAREPEQLRSELGSGAAEVARIVSEVRDRVQVELRGSGDPEDERYRLYQAVTGFRRNAADVQPLVIVLEDLHWADGGTLDLLLRLARNLQGTRLLLVGTYRDVEVDRAHPLSAALLGDSEQAMAHYQRALEVATKARYRPEIALTHLQMAELLLDSGSVGAQMPCAPTSAKRITTLRGAAAFGLRHRGVSRDEDAAVAGAGAAPQGGAEGVTSAWEALPPLGEPAAGRDQ